MAYYLELIHFFVISTGTYLKKERRQRQRDRTEKSELIPFLKLNPVLFTMSDVVKACLDYEMGKDIQAFIPMHFPQCIMESAQDKEATCAWFMI